MNFLTSLNAIQLIALVAMVIGGVGFLYVNRGAVGKFLSRFMPGGGTTNIDQTKTEVDQDTLEFQAWNLLRKKKSFQSPEAQQALKTLASHFVEV